MKVSSFAIVFVFLIEGLLFSCNAQNVTPQKEVNFKELAQKPQTAIIDVRTAEEFESGHIAQSINIPLQVIEDSVQNLKRFKDIILVCRSGNRSGKAKVILEEHGLKNIYNGGGWESLSLKLAIKTLIITGQNNHNWQVSHIAIKQILENTKLFSVDIAISPEKGQDMSSFSPDFLSYQLVILDYNGDSWTKETQKHFVDFVKKGGGVVVYHAADNAFSKWKEYNEICALGGWEGRNEQSGPWVYWKDGKLIKDNSPGAGGSHGKQHEYVLTARDENHPIVKGLPRTWKHAQDELYDRMRGPGNIASLLYTAYSEKEAGGSGREEPLLFTVKYGKGRIFHTMLGHAGKSITDNPAMQCVGFQVTLLRGAEWAATGKVTQKVPQDFPTENSVSKRLDYK